jgi:tRNA A37 methylthiotransferase MiaB
LGENEKIFLSGCGTIKDGKVDENFYTQYRELAQYREKIELLPEDPEDTPVKEIKPSLQNIKSAFAHIFTRKYIVVQMGCDNFCTFCLTVQARGRHRSRSVEEIFADVDEFVARGGKEVVITGINIGAW